MAKNDIVFTKNKEPFAFMHTARLAVVDYVHRTVPNAVDTFGVDDITIIWFTTNDDEWRVLLGTNRLDGLYYRIAHKAGVTKLSIFKQFDEITLETKES